MRRLKALASAASKERQDNGCMHGHAVAQSYSFVRGPRIIRATGCMARSRDAMYERALTRSSLSSLSLHLALGVMVGILEPSPAASRRRCLRPTLGGGGGGSHFRFFSCGVLRRYQYNGTAQGRGAGGPRKA